MSERDDLQSQWQGFEPERVPSITREALDEGVKKFRRSIFLRDFREILVAAIMAVLFTLKSLDAQNLVECVGDLMCTASVIWVGFKLHSQRPRKIPAATDPLDAHLVWYRQSLIDQAALLSRAWLWYVLPILTSVLVSYSGVIIARGARKGDAVMFTFVVVLGVFIAWLNKRAAKDLDARAAGLR